MHTKRIDLIYVEGTGDIVEALIRWQSTEDVMSETSRTFSGQVFDFCKRNDLETLAISAFPEKKSIAFAGFSAESFPKRILPGGIGFHVSQVLYGFRLLALVIRIRPKYVHLTNGVTHWFLMALLKPFGIKIFPHFHNTLWTKGYFPVGLKRKILLRLDGWFLSHVATMAFCVSAEIERQILGVTSEHGCKVQQFIPQFNRRYFATLPPCPEILPFGIVYAGRIERDKGVFDLLDIADSLRYEPVFFHICGDGAALNQLAHECRIRGLSDKVKLHGRLIRTNLLDIYSNGHAVIVPTRSEFTEGFAMVAAEAILLCRPIITSRIVPALELLANAAVEVEPENNASYVDAIRKLMFDRRFYEEKCVACLPLREQFLDGLGGLDVALEKSLTQR
jgi:glycogen synthase